MAVGMLVCPMDWLCVVESRQGIWRLQSSLSSGVSLDRIDHSNRRQIVPSHRWQYCLRPLAARELLSSRLSLATISDRFVASCKESDKSYCQLIAQQIKITAAYHASEPPLYFCSLIMQIKNNKSRRIDRTICLCWYQNALLQYN